MRWLRSRRSLSLSCFGPLFTARWEGDIDEPPCIDTVEKDQLAVFLVSQVLQKVRSLNKIEILLALVGPVVISKSSPPSDRMSTDRQQNLKC